MAALERGVPVEFGHHCGTGRSTTRSSKYSFGNSQRTFYKATPPLGKFRFRSLSMSSIPKKPPQSTPDFNSHFRDFEVSISKHLPVASVPNPLARTVSQEPYVDAKRVAEHLSLTRREVLKL